MKSAPLSDPVIMWEPNSGKQVKVKTQAGYDRYLNMGYVYLMDVADQQEVE